MNISMNKYIALTLLIISFVSTSSQAQTTGSSFSYQGELLDNGSPANADYDFGVDLYLTNIGGSPVTTDTHDDVTVENGLFNLEVDFGDVVYEDSDQYYIELRVTPSAGGATVVLSPRTKLLAVPYATQAQFSASGGGSWDVDGTTLSTLGNVGIGTSNPTDQLHVRSEDGESALRVQVNGQTKLRVRENGGTSIGINATPPENGLYVYGDVKQDSDSNGMLKYMFRANCDATPSIPREYNGTTVTGTASISRDSTGSCTITLPINISTNYLSVSAIWAGVGTNRIATCAPFGTAMLCKLSVGSTNAAIDGDFDVLIY